MPEATRPPWKVSLHGGHSGQFCDHAEGSLREVLEAAVAEGYHTFGVSEHAPRLAEHLLYDTERSLGWTVDKIRDDFETYAQTLPYLVDEFRDRLTILRGFEAEVVPDDRYAEIMLGYREQFAFDYMVGSVHYVDEVTIDGPKALFEEAVEQQGGVENLAVAYYEAVGRMVATLNPEIVGHLDLVRKNAPSAEGVETPRVREAADACLEVIREHDAILDLNTAGYRKGLGSPYPAPWLVERAHGLGIGFCFGDDSHKPAEVGAGIDEARDYLMGLGVETVTVLTRQEGAVVRRKVALDA